MCNSSDSNDETILATGESILVDTDIEDGITTEDNTYHDNSDNRKYVTNIYLHDVDALSKYTQSKIVTTPNNSNKSLNLTTQEIRNFIALFILWACINDQQHGCTYVLEQDHQNRENCQRVDLQQVGCNKEASTLQ